MPRRYGSLEEDWWAGSLLGTGLREIPRHSSSSRTNLNEDRNGDGSKNAVEAIRYLQGNPTIGRSHTNERTFSHLSLAPWQLVANHIPYVIISPANFILFTPLPIPVVDVSLLQCKRAQP